MRTRHQWLLAPIVIITIAFGWRYYWISFIVPIVMLVNILSLLFYRGRFTCGNLCPRGAFFDRILRPLSPKKKMPDFLRSDNFRLAIYVAIFGIFTVIAVQPPYSLEKFGHQFWLMCTVTTIIGIILGLFFSHRSWCGFCPIGTFLSTVEKDNHRLTIDKNLCISCKLCEKVCPMNINITKDRETGFLSNRDCLKCGECVAICPTKALK